MSVLARKLGVRLTTISMVLRGRGKSARILAAAESHAKKILRTEAQ